MADIVKLEEMYKKELELIEKHKYRAKELKQKIDEEKGQAILRSIKDINLSPMEFKRFQKALGNEENVRKLLREMGGSENVNGSGKESEKESQ